MSDSNRTCYVLPLCDLITAKQVKQWKVPYFNIGHIYLHQRSTCKSFILVMFVSLQFFVYLASKTLNELGTFTWSCVAKLVSHETYLVVYSSFSQIGSGWLYLKGSNSDTK